MKLVEPVVDISTKMRDWTAEERASLHKQVDDWLDAGDTMVIAGTNAEGYFTRWMHKEKSRTSTLEVIAVLDQLLLKEKLRCAGLLPDDDE